MPKDFKRVNLFVEFSNGEKSYRCDIIHNKKTILEIMRNIRLPTSGVKVYVNGDRITDFTQALEDLVSTSKCFISFVYGDMDLPKRSNS